MNASDEVVMEEGSRVLFAAISWRVIGGKLVGMRWMEGRCLRASRRTGLGVSFEHKVGNHDVGF